MNMTPRVAITKDKTIEKLFTKKEEMNNMIQITE